jgi:hypothetical protein
MGQGRGGAPAYGAAESVGCPDEKPDSDRVAWRRVCLVGKLRAWVCTAVLAEYAGDGLLAEDGHGKAAMEWMPANGL